jgi:diadenosine tetraphosphate (Ap4A) HIT family hydrolase
MSCFTLHPRLTADTFALGDWPLSRLLLMNDATYPWVVLVPRRVGVREVIDLAEDERALLWREVDRVASALAQLAKPDKLNIAAIGNLVPQLHVHVVVRREGDPAWPRPVWGAAPATPYAPDAATAFASQLRRALALPDTRS